MSELLHWLTSTTAFFIESPSTLIQVTTSAGIVAHGVINKDLILIGSLLDAELATSVSYCSRAPVISTA